MASYTLRQPVVLPDKRQFAVLTMDGATLGGVAAHQTAIAATGSSTAALIAMLTIECDWPREAVMKIAAEEMEAIIEALNPFGFVEPDGMSGETLPPTSLTS